MAFHPKAPRDMMLAPVAARIDRNLQALRDLTLSEIAYDLEVQLDTPPMRDDAAERAERIRRVALRGVDLHGWQAAITADASRLALTGGSVSLDLGLSANLTRYIADGGAVSAPDWFTVQEEPQGALR